MRQIVGLQIKRLTRQLEQNGIALEVSDAALDHIAVEGYDPVYGARPLKRVIQQRLQNPLAMCSACASVLWTTARLST